MENVSNRKFIFSNRKFLLKDDEISEYLTSFENC
jgi:hypothetical protein